MKKLKLSLSEKIVIFLNEYYFGYGALYSISRIISGSLIFIIGLNLYANGNTKFGISYSGFLVIFGVYYTLKSLVILLTKKSWFKSFDLDYSITPEKIIIQSDKSKSELDYSELDKVLKRKAYFALKTKSKQGIYLPIKNLEFEEMKILNKLQN